MSPAAVRVADSGVDYWRRFAIEAERSDAPLYARLARDIADDRDLRAFASQVRAGQPPANMLFGAVHYLLLRGAEHSLKQFYRTLNGGAPDESADDPFPHFREFAIGHRDRLASLLAARIVNTNEVGRSALLHAGFRALAQEAGEPLNLIEIGSSAGLNLLWDDYGVCYTRGDERCFTEPRGLPLVLDCELRGDAAPLLGPPPRIGRRIGLERNPVDLSRPEERDWLKALVWPDHVTRFRRLEQALAIFAGKRPEIRAGDALALLPETTAEIPEDQPLCVYHTMALYQFPREMRQAFDNLLMAASLRRPVWRLGLEDDLKGSAPLRLGLYREGRREVRTLALCSSHGRWMEWRG